MSRDDVQNLRVVQELNVCYLFCGKDGRGEYRPYVFKRYDTFDWRLSVMPALKTARIWISIRPPRILYQ